MIDTGTIEVDRLTKRFGSVTAVDDLSFTVRPGHVTGFLGPNGAGKTTTMRIILGLAAPTSGRALVGGRRYDALIRPLREVGSLLDATALHGGRTAWMHLVSVARSNGIERPRITEVLRLTGLEAVANRRVKGFSLGMKQRLGIAAALLGDPPVLMFDEPVNGLDPEGIHWIRGFFKELATQGRTVLVSSHLMSEMALTADHLIIIGRGKLLADLPTARLIESSGRGDVLVRSPRAAELAGLLTARGANLTRQDDGALAARSASTPAPSLAIRAMDLVASEWTKFRSVRSSFWSLLVAVVTPIGVSTLVAVAFANQPAAAGPPPDPLLPEVLSLEYAVIAVSVMGVLAFSAEYSTGLIRTTFTAAPRGRGGARRQGGRPRGGDASRRRTGRVRVVLSRPGRPGQSPPGRVAVQARRARGGAGGRPAVVRVHRARPGPRLDHPAHRRRDRRDDRRDRAAGHRGLAPGAVERPSRPVHAAGGRPPGDGPAPGGEPVLAWAVPAGPAGLARCRAGGGRRPHHPPGHLIFLPNGLGSV
jgi:ABC-2 type transport system ATP-binding protein